MDHESPSSDALEIDEADGEIDLGDGGKTKGGSWINPDPQP